MQAATPEVGVSSERQVAGVGLIGVRSARAKLELVSVFLTSDELELREKSVGCRRKCHGNLGRSKHLRAGQALHFDFESLEVAGCRLPVASKETAICALPIPITCRLGAR